MTIDELISVIIEIESGGNTMAVGDNHLINKAYGILQIRQPVIDDYNSWNGSKLKASDMLGNEQMSRTVFMDYIHHYATKKRIGRDVTDVDRARCWNGGPNGWNKKSTYEYGRKVVSIAQKWGISV